MFSYTIHKIRFLTLPFIMLLAITLVPMLSAQAAPVSIMGTLDYASDTGGLPTAIFGLNVPSGAHQLMFTVTYEDTTADGDPGNPNGGQYNGITQLDLTIGGNSVQLITANGDLTTDNSSNITVGNNVGGVVDSFTVVALDTAAFPDSFTLDLDAPTTLFSNDGLMPIGGVDPLNQSDFSVSQTAQLLSQFGFGPTVTYSVNSLTFPNSAPPVPVPSAMLLMGSGLVGLVGWRCWNTKKA